MKVKDVIEQFLKLNQEAEVEIGTIAGRIPLKDIKIISDKPNKEIALLLPFKLDELK